MKNLSILAALGLSFAMPQAEAALVAADWNADATGTLGSITVTSTGFSFPSLYTSNLSGADFDVAALGANQELLAYRVNSDWTLNFSSPVQDLLLYMLYWRGTEAGVDPVNYVFNRSFTILDGLSGATVDGTTFRVPGSGWSNGILLFSGSVSSLTLSSPSTASGLQALTVGYGYVAPVTVPVPASLPLLAGGLTGLAAIVRRRKRG